MSGIILTEVLQVIEATHRWLFGDRDFIPLVPYLGLRVALSFEP